LSDLIQRTFRHFKDPRRAGSSVRTSCCPDQLFAVRHFDRDVIILCVRWYLRYKPSLRDLIEMMAERRRIAPCARRRPLACRLNTFTASQPWVCPSTRNNREAGRHPVLLGGLVTALATGIPRRRGGNEAVTTRYPPADRGLPPHCPRFASITVNAAILTMRLTVALEVRMLTGALTPNRNGPTATLLPAPVLSRL